MDGGANVLKQPLRTVNKVLPSILGLRLDQQLTGSGHADSLKTEEGTGVSEETCLLYSTVSQSIKTVNFVLICINHMV
jgi:anaerobic glycerol-3-phosphate dehydrogenase